MADRLGRQRDDDRRRRDIEDERLKQAMRQRAEEEIQAERRRADEHRAKLEQETIRVRALAEAEGRAKEQRANEDVHSRQLLLRAEQDRRTTIDAINVTFTNLASYLGSFVLDRERMGATVVGLTALAAGVYLSREGARVGAALLQKRLLTPALVRETSRSSAHFSAAKRVERALGLSAEKEGTNLKDVILRPDLYDRVSKLAVSVKNARSNGAPYRHMLLYGPPGTGKTMVAKRLARSSGMDYAILSGGDVGPLGRDAVTELHRLFDWAGKSKRGLLLFIDEADAFLASRSRASMSEDQRNALNAMLFRTGEASYNCMVVLATNRPGDLDRAVTDRVDESLHFDLPGPGERKSLVRQYFDTYVRNAGNGARFGPFGLLKRKSAQIEIDKDIDDACLGGIAGRLDGFSGREISKLMISVAGAVHGQGSPVLSRQLLDRVVQWKVDEHAVKGRLGSAEFDFVAHHHGGPRTAEASASSSPSPSAADHQLSHPDQHPSSVEQHWEKQLR